MENNEPRSVPLNPAAESHPLKDAVICCTSVPDEKRVRPNNPAFAPLYINALLTIISNCRPNWHNGLSKWELYIDTT